VIVALGAPDGKSEEGGNRRCRLDPAPLRCETARDRCPLLVDLGVAIEARGNFLLDGRVRQQVTRKLFDDKLVKRQIAVQGRRPPRSRYFHIWRGASML